MHKQFNLYWLSLFLVMIFGIVSCQEPAEEISPPDSETAFVRNSVLGDYAANISLLDGSFDNAVDNTSCFTVSFPVEVSVKGVDFTINSLNEMEPIIAEHNKNPYQKDLLTIKYPITVYNANHGSEVVASQQAMDLLVAQCAEGGTDLDIECVDFVYPISVATYDPQNQLADTRVMTNDKSFHEFLNNRTNEEYIGFSFPLSVITPEGQVTVQNNTELKNTIGNSLDACDENDRRFYSLEPLSMGSVSLALTDAPFPLDLIEEANVTITEIQIKTGGANDSVPYITLLDEDVSYNLIELVNGVTEELSEVEIPAGSYQFLRVFVKEGSVLLKDGTFYDLKIPSGSQSGIKIQPKSQITISDDLTTELLLDFDLSRSFVVQGNPNTPAGIKGFIFKPVIKVSITDQTGQLKGEVTDEMDGSLEGVMISIYAADTLNTTSFTDAEGDYKILGLEPGVYRVEAEYEGFESESVEEVEIFLGEETIQDFILVAD